MKNQLLLQSSMKRSLFTAALLCLFLLGFSTKMQAQLAKGDIAFNSFNADEDGFSVVTFVAIPANTVIYFTDNEATGETTFNSGESYFQWNTGSAVIAAGTVIRFSSVDTAALAASVGTLTRGGVSGNSNYGFAAGGDAIYAYLGSSITSPTLILTVISSGETVSPGNVITNAGLTTGINAIVLRTSADYGVYNGARSGQATFAAYKALVFDVANWTVDQNDGNYATTVPNTTAFTLATATPTVNLSVSTATATEAAATVITVTATASAAVSGDQTVTLTVSGTDITTGDYALSNTTITILSGQTTGTVTFTVTDDAVTESTETAVLTISNPSSGIALGTTLSQNIAITDNDAVAAPALDLSNYIRVGRYDLPEPTRTAHPVNNLLCQEASAVTYNWDTDTLFITADGSTSVTQVSKTGQLINTMTMAQGNSPQGTDFYDTEGITYIGNGQFVMAEERDRQLVKFTYAANTTLTRANTQTVKIGTFVNNTGTEGLSYDPLTGGYIVLKEIDPIGIFQTNVDFAAGTATNGSPTTVNSINLFNPDLLGMADVADVFALSNIPAYTGQPLASNLLVLSQESAKVVNISRTGVISSTLNLVSDAGNPLNIASQQHEGITMDNNGFIYIVSENGGGDIDHPQLWVYAPSTMPNQAPTAVTLSNVTTSILENTVTTPAIKVADIVVADDGIGTNTLTLSGADAADFQITGTGLYIKAGTVLDFETKTSYNVTVVVDDTTVGNTPDATVAYTLTVLDVAVETPVTVSVRISEVAPWGSSVAPISADWFEVTNTGTTAINLTGWKMDDNSNGLANAVALNGISSIAPGESVIFLESTASNPAATVIANFKSVWFGANPLAALQVGTYQGSGVGLSTGSDAVNLYDNNGTLQANVTFGTAASNPYKSFNNAIGLNNAAVSLLSEVGVNDAFAAVNDATQIGSPGSVGHIFVSEVAPWSSGNSPVGADWFEVTNTKAVAVDITGWKVDDNSQSPAGAVALNGITSINPGESVIFIESANLAAITATFLNNWFGANPPAALRIGNYSGSGIGLGTGGDQVNLYNGVSSIPVNTVIFGTSPTGTYATFDNAAGLHNATISQLSAVGVNGAFVAVNSANEIGSPGRVVTPPCTPSTHTTTVVNCDSYTWANNGQTYTTSGTYTGTTTNCVTEQLVLTINRSTTNGSATITASGSYTWAENGQTYTTSGVYTNTTTNAAGCPNVATLNLTVSPIVNTFTLGTSCGATVNSLAVTIKAAVVQGAQSYTFRVTNMATNAVFTVSRPVNSFALSNYLGITLATQYQIEVSVNNGITYGAPCTVFTPAPTSTIGTQCGTVLTSMTQFVYATYVASVPGYRFRITNLVTNASTEYTAASGLNRFNFNQLPVAFRTPGTTFSVEVALQNTNGAYLPYGPACNISTQGTTPVVTKLAVDSAVNFAVVAYPNPFSDIFMLDVTTAITTDIQVVVYDMLGKQLENRTIPAAEIANLQIGNDYPSGIYNVIVSQDENVKTLRLIKR